MTDHEGVFHFPDVTTSTASLTATKPGFYQSPDGDGVVPRLLHVPDTTPADLVLYPEAILSGTIVDMSGESMANLSVVARRSVFDESGHHWYPSGQTQTASDGSFRLPVASGVYSMLISQRGRLPNNEVVLPLEVPATASAASGAIHLAPGHEEHLDLRVETRKSYQVAVSVEPESRGFPQLTARMANGAALPLSPIPVSGDRHGDLRVALPSGTYTLLGSMQNQDGLSEAQTEVTVADHDLSNVTLHFTSAPTLPLMVEADISATSDKVKLPEPQQLGISLVPLGDAPDSIGQIYRASSRRNAPLSFSVPNGVYRLRGQSGGQWYVTSATCGGVDLLADDLPVTSDLSGTEIRVRVSNQPANLSGSVTLDGAPAAAWIYLVSTNPSATPVLILRSGTDGTFFRPYLAPGTYRAVALERKLSADFQAPATLNLFLDRLQTFTVNPGEQRKLTLIAAPERDLPQ